MPEAGYLSIIKTEHIVSFFKEREDPMSGFTKLALAATMAITVVGTSMTGAEAGKRERNIALGVGAAILGAAIIADQSRKAKRRHYVRDCWYEYERRWSNRRGRYVTYKIRVCD